MVEGRTRSPFNGIYGQATDFFASAYIQSYRSIRFDYFKIALHLSVTIITTSVVNFN